MRITTGKLLTPLTLTGLSLLVTSGCTSDAMDLRERTITAVAPSGGEARSAGGELTLSFSNGALSSAQDIVIETFRTRTAPRLVSAVYELGPDGLAFDAPVTLSITLPSPDENEIYAIANLDGAYPDIIDASDWDPATNTVSAELPHFSSWGVVTVYVPCGGKSCGDSCTICDPLDPSCVEPSPANKSCNRSGFCVDASIAMCPVPMDAGTSTPTPDAGLIDAGTIDSGLPDTGLPDTGTSTPTPDAGTVDAGTVDGGALDAGVIDSGVTACTDTFQQNASALIDVLVVLDRSGSMGEEQANLANSFPLLLQTLTANNADFHIGVTTIDPMTGGTLVGNPPVLTPNTPNLQQAFTNTVTGGQLGGGIEHGLEASRRVLTSTLGQTLFLRNNSWLSVIYVSDEDDQSPDSTADYVQFFQNLRPGRVQLNTIVGDLPMGCSGTNGNAAPGDRYDAVRIATGGVFDSICDSDWPQALTELGPSGLGYESDFVLTQPAPGGILSVSVDGVPIPSVDSNGIVLWTYNAATQTISFTQFAVPEPSAVIVVNSDC